MSSGPLKTGCGLMVLGLLRRGHHLVGEPCGRGAKPSGRRSIALLVLVPLVIPDLAVAGTSGGHGKAGASSSEET